MNTEEQAVATLLKMMDANPEREGLADTPKRFVKFMKEFMSPPEFKFTTFKNEGADEMVVVSNIPFFSLCEHHMAPFMGHGTIAYIPRDKIVGLSKLPRALDHFARRLQNQERITSQVCDFIMTELMPKGVGVLIRARHLCVEMRGVAKHDVWTTTSSLTGCFKEDAKCRSEFWQIATRL